MEGAEEEDAEVPVVVAVRWGIIVIMIIGIVILIVIFTKEISMSHLLSLSLSLSSSLSSSYLSPWSIPEFPRLPLCQATCKDQELLSRFSLSVSIV